MSSRRHSYCAECKRIIQHEREQSKRALMIGERIDVDWSKASIAERYGHP